MREVITWSLYDTRIVPFQNGQHRFFTRLEGRPLSDTNMVWDGQLLSGQEFRIGAVEVDAPQPLTEMAALRLIIGGRDYVVISAEMARRRPYVLDLPIILQPAISFGVDFVVTAPIEANRAPARVCVMLHGHLAREA